MESGPHILWQGDLETWMDEHFVGQIWASLGYPVTVRLIRDKTTGESQKYCFVHFPSPEIARICLENFNGTQIPGVPGHTRFRLNSANGLAKTPGEQEFAMFVGDLGREVNDHMLYSVFKDRFPSVRNAKVVMDAMTGNSKGYGFVRFADEYDYTRALTEMQGQHVGSRAIRVSMGNNAKAAAANAAPSASNSSAAASSYSNPSHNSNFVPSSGANAYANLHIPGPNDPEYSNTNIYITGLPPNTTEQDLLQVYIDFGNLNSVKVLPGKGVGFVNYSMPENAIEAFRKTQGILINGVVPKITWAKINATKSSGYQPSVATYQPVPNYNYVAPTTTAAATGYGYYGAANPAMDPMMAAAMQQHLKSPVTPVTPKVYRPPTPPPPDPLEPVSVLEENNRYVAHRQTTLINAEARLTPPTQAYPLPLPLLY